MKDTYGNKMNVNTQNSKCFGTAIHNIDTFRGCNLACESCYAKRNSAISIKNFEVPVKVLEFSGKVHDNIWYRIGNSGDPATGWKHSEQLIRKYKLKNFFCVTKLQSTSGFTGFFDKLQVSLDPLNNTHFFRTLKNVEYIIKNHPKVKIILRVRSVSTTNILIMALQDTAVKFADMNHLPIMETRMRFNNRAAFEKYNLVTEDYEWRGSYYRPRHGLKLLVGVKKYYDCDLFGMKCINCSNCTIPWSKEQFNKKGEFIAPSQEKQPTKEVA